MQEARRLDKASHETLNRLRALPENSHCFDCDAPRPGWAALPHGIFVCIDCAQQHRSLGRHISQTKAINTGTYLWMPYELRVMQNVGNGVAARAFAMCNLPEKPSRGASAAEKMSYAKVKYNGQCRPDWVGAMGSEPLAASFSPSKPTSVPPTPLLPHCRTNAQLFHASKPGSLSLELADLISFDDPLPEAKQISCAQVAGTPSTNFFEAFGL